MTRHRPTAERRAQILSAARACFLETGYHATKVETIARAAGLSKGAVYFHFDSKRALLEALVDQEFERASGLLDSLAESEEALASAAERFFEWMKTADDPSHRFFLLSGELAVHDDALRKRLETHHLGILARIEALLQTQAARHGLDATHTYGFAVLLKALADGLQGSLALGMPIDQTRVLLAGSAAVRLGLGLMQPR